MAKIVSFDPISSPSAHILILGTMPGVASLNAKQYYAYPRNHFWRIMDVLLNEGKPSSYAERVGLLKKNNIALWDVLHACEREGSLDSAIAHEEPNDLSAFLNEHKKITRIFFNGAPAEKLFKKWVLPTISADNFSYYRLPSTSPANAFWSFERKLEVWREIKSTCG